MAGENTEALNAPKTTKKPSRRVLVIVLVIFLALFLIIFVGSLLAKENSKTPVVSNTQPVEQPEIRVEDNASAVQPQFSNSDSRFGFVNAGQDFIGLAKFGVGWDRPYPGPFNWQQIQDGNYGPVDEYVKEAQKHDFATVAIIWPYWDADQDLCHAEDLPAVRFGKFFGELASKRGKPCGHDAYKNFVMNLVERYDGDGKDDMPGLRYGIKHWEVASEPEVQDRLGGVAFFQGKPKDYVELFRDTFVAVKTADPDAKVLNGGAATASAEHLSFWEEFLRQGGGKYVDIFSMHCLECDESLEVEPYAKLLKKYEMQTPIWVTDVSYFGSDNEQAKNLFKGYITGFGSGVQKIFYDKWQIRAGGKEELAALKTSTQDRLALNATDAVIKKIGGFTMVEKLGDGHYRFYFTESGRVRDAYLKASELPEELQGNLKMTAYDGIDTIRYNVRNIDSATIPVIVEAV
ncbi:MAG: hypothetical protein HY438_03805 [DPANN group archaeon]|nr:hypothetical protein [DPANN group archaeon]